MLLELEIELSRDIEKDLFKSLEDVTKEIVRVIAEDAPVEMQMLMATSTPSGNNAIGGGKHSAKGQPPAIVTRELFRSLQGKIESPNSASISMAEHAFYLDPIFEGQGKGGGYLNRPFIEEGIVRSLKKNL